MAGSGQLMLGFAVWAFAGWDGTLYAPGTPRRALLQRYAQRVQTVEGNSVFYAVPSTQTLARWVEQTPPGFRFCPKVPRTISHEGRLSDHTDALLRFLDHMREGLGCRLGPIFLQLPPHVSPHQGPELARLLNAWRREGAHPLLTEVRHPGWYAPGPGARLDTMLARLGQGRVVLDTRPIYSGDDDPQRDNPRKKPPLPLHAVAVGSHALVRLCSHPDAERNRPYFAEWVQHVKQWLDQGVQIYFFMHCPREEFSPINAQLFLSMLQDAGVSVPALTLHRPAQQAGLF